MFALGFLIEFSINPSSALYVTYFPSFHNPEAVISFQKVKADQNLKRNVFFEAAIAKIYVVGLLTVLNSRCNLKRDLKASGSTEAYQNVSSLSLASNVLMMFSVVVEENNS